MAIGMGEPKERVRAMMIEVCPDLHFVWETAAEDGHRR